MATNSQSTPSAPILEIAEIAAVAVEHPMIVMNVDNALKTFGRNHPFTRILVSDHPDECVPLYLRPHDPMGVPILSQSCQTKNLLLKVTVPKRTGRTRKLGSQDPYSESNLAGSVTPSNNQAPNDQVENVQSFARRDSPVEILRKLKDNVGRYELEVVAKVGRTHRFRGLTDFHQSTSNTPFFSKFRDTAFTGHVDGLRGFKLDPSQGLKPNDEVIPPPLFTAQPLPFIWAWHQNPVNIMEFDEDTGNPVSTNPSSQRRKRDLQYVISRIPTVPGAGPKVPEDVPGLLDIIFALREAFEKRPVWSRRALVNEVASHPYASLCNDAFQYVGYQFKGGPFRDALIKFGVDPRTDKKYRMYQTIVFKIYLEEEKVAGMQWEDVRTGFSSTKRAHEGRLNKTHIFDGNTLTLDGKIFQLCDITDPFIITVIEGLTLRDEFEFKQDGWFSNGAWAKLRAIMRTKIIAIRTGRVLRDEDFKAALAFPDIHPGKNSNHLTGSVPVPNIKLTNEEIERLRDEGKLQAVGSNGIRKRKLKARYETTTGTAERGYKQRGRPRKVIEKEVNMLPSEIWPDDQPFQIFEVVSSMKRFSNWQTQSGRGTGQSSVVDETRACPTIGEVTECEDHGGDDGYKDDANSEVHNGDESGEVIDDIHDLDGFGIADDSEDSDSEATLSEDFATKYKPFQPNLT